VEGAGSDVPRCVYFLQLLRNVSGKVAEAAGLLALATKL
jgi:hypothetical protein